MPELKISRSYHDALRRIGVQNPGEVGVQTPVTLTAAVDDFTHLAAPVSVPIGWARTSVSGAIGLLSGFEVIGGGRGTYLLQFEDQTNNFSRGSFHESNDPPDFVIAGAETIGTGGPFSTIIQGVRMTSPIIYPQASFRGGFNIYPLFFFLEPGRRFRVVHSITNSAGTYGIWIREVPTGLATRPVEP